MSSESRQGPPAGETVSQPNARILSIEERRRLVAASLQRRNPQNGAKDLPDPKRDCQLELSVEDIRTYVHNLRRTNNPKFFVIKESIRAIGIRNPLTVTRRPGENHFIVEVGGNTRLLALQQLWKETRDPRFEKLTVFFRPWRSETHVIAAHLIDNEVRGELTFWDKASGVVAVKALLEEEKGRTLSLRQLEEELKLGGLRTGVPSLSRYLYAVERLRTLGDGIPVFSELAIKHIQPRLSLMRRYVQMQGMSEATLFETVFEPVFARSVEAYRREGTFKWSELCLACEAALAQHLGESADRLRLVLDTLAMSPQATLESLRGSAAPISPELKSPPHASGPVSAPPEGVHSANTHAPGPVPTPPEGVYSANTRAAPGSVPTPCEGVYSANTPAGQASRPSTRRARSGTSSYAPAATQPLYAAITRLVQLTKITECLRPWKAAPLGYYMELPSAPLGADIQDRPQHWSWWILAVLSGQRDDKVLAILPQISRWREFCEQRDGHLLAGPAPRELPTITVADYDFIDWLLQTPDEAADAFIEVITLVQESRGSSAPSRQRNH